MKRLGRYVLHGITALSLLLGVAAVIFWFRSYRPSESLYRISQNGWANDSRFVLRGAGIGSSRGQIGWVRAGMQGDKPELLRPFLSGGWHGLRVELLPTRDSVIRLPDNSGEVFWHRLPESCRIDPADLPAIRRMWHDRYDAEVASLPWWGIAPLFLVLPAARAGTWLRRAQRRRQGRCPACGYDLCATPERCPECGKIPAWAKT